MTWAKLDDRFHEHRKVRQAWRVAPAAIGLHVMAITYAAGQETDGHVDRWFVEEKIASPTARRKIVGALVDAGLWEATDDGWSIHDFLVYNQSREQNDLNREWDRRRKELSRDPKLLAAIRKRDEDRCRYCGKKVNWRDRRSEAGGTYDHVIPRGDNTLDNVVVACRSCNFSKGARTPDSASMPLLSPGQIGSIPGTDVGQNGSGQSKTPDPTRPDPTRPTDIEVPGGMGLSVGARPPEERTGIQ